MITLDIDPANNPAGHPFPTLERRGDTWMGNFEAMGSPCEILLEGITQSTAKQLVESACIEAWRIEYKFSRYVSDNIVFQINNSHGNPIRTDDETARLLDYANHCFELTEGLFDITSGALRQAWKFDGSENIPTLKQVEQIIPRVGWDKVTWKHHCITLAAGMEIDFGGIGKEYAVDRTLSLLTTHIEATHPRDVGILVNFGGDIACGGQRLNNAPWCVGVESQLNPNAATNAITLRHGGVATSGDTRRFLIHRGERLGHILDPRTGWPIKEAPHSVTVIAQTCTLAGMMATFAMLEGSNAEQFLSEQSGIKYWVQR